MLVPFFRTLILYIFIITAVRLMGKRQVGEMQPTELVVTILVSAVVSVPMQDLNIPLIHGLVPVLTLVGAEVLISVLSLKSLTFRRILTGKPVAIINNGELDQKAMRKLRLTLDDVFEDLRLKDVFDFRDVKSAFVETSGQLSVLLNASAQPPSAKQLSLSPPQQEPYYMIVSDGKLIPKNLGIIGRNEKWLNSILKEKGAAHINHVFYLCADKQGNVLYCKREVN